MFSANSHDKSMRLLEFVKLKCAEKREQKTFLRREQVIYIITIFTYRYNLKYENYK